MTIYYRAYSDPADTLANFLAASFAAARALTSSTAGNVAGSVGRSGVRFDGGTSYYCYQGFLQFDTSSFPATGSAALSIYASALPSTAGEYTEVSEVSSLANKIAGASLSGLTQLGAVAHPTGAARRLSITLSGTPTQSAALKYALYGRNERIDVAPAGTLNIEFYLADRAGTIDDPYVEVISGTAWTYVGTGTSVEATATSHILTEPAGVAAGDLLVACIASRIASTTQITLPSGWTRVNQALNNNTLSTSSALPSGMMAYILRGASPPSYTFTHPVAPNVALGRVVAYRNVHQTTPLDSGSTAVTTGTALLSISVTGLTTTADDDLIVALTAGGQEAAWSAFGATDPATGSGTTSASVLDPAGGQWLERADVLTTTGNDTSLAIFDAVKQTAGATGNLIATASVSAGHVVVAGSFKLVPPVSGTTYNETVAETLTAAETVALLTESLVRETEAADWRETESGAIRITEGDFFVTPAIDVTIAESAAAVETLTSALAYTKAVAETAAAADTAGGLLVRIGAIAEVASAADTVGGLMIRLGAVAETTSAADTTDAAVVPAAGVFDEIVAETTAAAETVGGLLIFTGAVAENAISADTITKTVNFTGAIAETAAAAETVTGLFNTTKAIVETASAVDTPGALLTFTGAVAETAGAAETLAGGLAVNATVAETASAAETISKTLTYTGAIAETAAAADTAGGLLLRIGAVAETASATETAAGLLTSTAAIAETAGAAETITYSVTGASGTTYNEAQVETAAAAETVANLMIFNGAIAETASAAETISKAVSYTVAVEETISAATITGLGTSYAPGSDRNDFDGAVGVRLGIGGTGIPINQIGVRTHAGASGTRTLQLYEWFSNTIQRSVTVDLTGHATDEYVWGEIAPITLTAGGYYGLVMEVSAGGPIWSNPGPTTFNASIVNVYDIYRVGAVGAALATGTPNSQFVGLDLGSGSSGAGAVETVTGLMVRIGAVAESASAAETVTGLRASTAAIAETAAAVETIVPTVVPAGGEVPWTPEEITSGMVVWYDAADAPTLVFSGSNLTQWSDKSPAANHAIPWSTGPTLTSVNSLGSLYFEYQGLRTTSPVSLGDFTVFVVFTAQAPGNYERLLDHSFVNGFWVGRQVETAVWGGGVRNTSDPYGYYVALSNSTAHQISMQRAGAVEYVSGNGGAVVSSGAVTTTATTSNYISIGSSFDNATATDMLSNDTVSEVVIWSTALSADDMARTEGYLAWKWGIEASLPVDHPYKDAPPTVAGAGVVFSETVAESALATDAAGGLLTFTGAIVETASAAETIIPVVVPAGGTLYDEAVLETLAANDEFSADVIPGEVVVPPLPPGGIGHGGGGKRRRHLFIYENVPADNDDEEDEEPKPQPKRKLRLKKAEVEEKIEDAIAWIEAGSPRPLQPMSQQALVAEVSAVLDIAALLEADRRRVERTIYRYVAALLAEEEEEEGVAMMLLAA